MYKKLHGFTLVELVIVIAVIGILVPVTMFSINGLSTTAQDRERESDATSIARQLELVYTNKVIGGSATYPGTSSVTANAAGEAIFGGQTVQITKAPGSSTFDILAASNTTQTTTGVSPQPSKGKYVYQPLTALNAACSSQCGKFNLYYWSEAKKTVIMIKSMRQQ